MPQATMERAVAKKKNDDSPELKRYGTMIRVSDDFAEAVRKVCGMENISVAEFADKYLIEVARKMYDEAILREAKRIQSSR